MLLPLLWVQLLCSSFICACSVWSMGPGWDLSQTCSSLWAPSNVHIPVFTRHRCAQCTVHTNPTLSDVAQCSLVCPVYTKQLLAALFHYKHSTSENQRNLISLLEAILQIITNLYSKIPNKSHHDLELQVFLSADWSHFAGKNIDGCKQHFRIDPIPGSMFPLQTPIVAT